MLYAITLASAAAVWALAAIGQGLPENSRRQFVVGALCAGAFVSAVFFGTLALQEAR